MEILTFLGLTPKRLVGLGALSALTASGVAVLATRQPATYSATATVFVGQALPEDANVFDLPPLVADFQTVATWKPIVDGAATAAEVGPGQLVVTTKRNGDGSAVQLTVVAPTAEAAQTGATRIALGGMEELTRRATQRSTKVEAEKVEALTKARQQVERLETANGWIDPIATYADVQKEATRLELVAQDPASQLTEAQRAAYVAQAAKLREQLPDLATKKETYRVARETLAQAETELRDATKATAAAEALQASATDPAVVSVDASIAGSALPAMVRAGGAAALITGLAGVGLISALDRRKRAPATVGEASEVPAVDAKPPTNPAPSAETPQSLPDKATSSISGTTAAEGAPQASTSVGATASQSRPTKLAESSPAVARASVDAHGTKKGLDNKPSANGAPKTAAPATPTPKAPGSDKTARVTESTGGPADKNNGRTVGLFQGRDGTGGAAKERSR